MSTAYNVEKLLKLVALGDQQAFSLLFEQEYKKVNSFAYRLTRSKEYAEEIVQDVFLKLWINRHKLDTVENWGGYLNRLVRNHSFNVLRRIALETVTANEMRKRNSELDTDTENEIDFRGTKLLLNEAISSLSPQQQKVYNLCHLEGLKYAEAAEMLNISPGTVQSHMKQALSNIRKYLSRYAPVILFASAISAQSPSKIGLNKISEKKKFTPTTPILIPACHINKLA